MPVTRARVPTAIAGLLVAALVAIVQAQSPAPSLWPRYNDPFFSLLAPIDAMRGQPPKAVLAELDKLQPQIAAAPAAVQSRAQFIRATTLRLLPDLAGATKAAEEAYALGVRAGHGYLEFDSLMLLVALDRDRGDLDAAAAHLTTALPAADRTGELVGRFNVRLEQGRLLFARGRGAQALAPLTEALEIAERGGSTRLRMQALTSRSTTRLGVNDYDGALADAQLAYDLAKREVGIDVQASAAFALGQTLSQIGDLERGLQYWTESVDLYTRAGVPLGVSLATRQRMDVYFALGDYESAEADGLKARELFPKTGSAGQEPAVLSRLALIEAKLGRPEAAAAYAKEAAAKAASAAPRVRTQIESDLATVALEQKDFADAAVRYGRMLEQGRTLRDQDVQWRALRGLGRAAAGAGDLATAETRFEAAIALIESMRRTLPEAGLRADFIAERLGPYDGLIDTLLRRSTRPGDAAMARAFETSERARGRALADLLAEAQARLTDPAVAKVRTQEAEFGKRLSAIQTAIIDAKSDPDRRARVADLERAEREYDAMVVRIRRETPRYAALAHPRATAAAEIAKTLASDEALVSFWIGDARGAAFVVTRTQLSSYPLPGRRDIDRDVARLKSAITGGQIEEVRRLGAGLYRTLFQGVGAAPIRRLILVPDGPLWRVPFAALTVDAARGEWLIARTAISLVPSASLLTALSVPPSASTARQPAVVFGLEQVPPGVRALRLLYDDQLLPDRPLRYAVAEAQAVTQLSSADARTALFLNDRADETSFKRSVAAPVRVVHVASHALIDDRSPRRSALVLAASDKDDGLLQLNEIANLQLDADLVVLSTCQSQLGRAVRGEGLVSLSRAFIHSGARAVTASLWAVDDRETSRLMPHFYAALRAGSATDEALRRAQLTMIQAGGADAAPSSWAGFVVTGRAGTAIFAK